LDIQGDEFTVHALSPSSYGGIIDDSMPQMVLRLFVKEVYSVVYDVRFFHSVEELA
jgi:multicomponent Na+:H+ antiporter subunit E